MFLRFYLCLGALSKCFHELYKEIISWEREKKRSKSPKGGKNLIAIRMKFFCWALSAGKLILLSKEIDWKIDTTAPLNIRS